MYYGGIWNLIKFLSIGEMVTIPYNSHVSQIPFWAETKVSSQLNDD